MNDDPKHQKLSSAYKELEEIVTQFENGKVDLEKGIPLFKRGLELAKMLKEKLAVMENEIIKIKDDFKDVTEDTGSDSATRTEQSLAQDEIPF